MKTLFDQHGVVGYTCGLIKELIRGYGVEVIPFGRLRPSLVHAIYSKPILEQPRILKVASQVAVREGAEEIYKFFAGDVFGSVRHVANYLQLRSIMGKCDLIHLNGCSSYTFMWLLRKCAGKPFIVTVHNLPHPEYELLPSRKIFEWKQKHVLRRMYSSNIPVATVSKFMRRMLLTKYGIASKVIHHGVDSNLFNPAVPREKMRRLLNIPQDFTCILWVGYLDPLKDPLTLIRAIPAVLEKHKKVKFVMVCKRKGQLDRLVLARVHDGPYSRNILFVGHAAYASMPFIYAAADIFVSTSLLETFGLSVLEAMACGKAVVVSDQEASLEVLNGKGLIFQKGKPQDLADKLTLLIEDTTLRRNMGRSAYLMSREHFTWKTAAAEYVKMYRQVVDG